MNAVRFHTVIGADQIIRPPEGVCLTPGEVEVIVLQPPVTSRPESETLRDMVNRLARAAEEAAPHDLPSDLAANHDHYLHGAPKGIDQP